MHVRSDAGLGRIQTPQIVVVSFEKPESYAVRKSLSAAKSIRRCWIKPVSTRNHVGPGRQIVPPRQLKPPMHKCLRYGSKDPPSLRHCSTESTHNVYLSNMNRLPRAIGLGALVIDWMPVHLLVFTWPSRKEIVSSAPCSESSDWQIYYVLDKIIGPCE